MRNWCKQHGTAALLLGCYLLGVAVFLAVHLGQFIHNRLAYASGALVYAELTLDDVSAASELELEGGALVTKGHDPQLLFVDAEMRVETLRLVAAYSQAPLVQTVFWATPGDPYSLRQMAYPHSTGAAGTLFLLPVAGGQSIRLDPDTTPGNHIMLEKIIVNEKRPFYLFFLPGAGEVALLLTLPGLAACALWLARGAVRLVASRRKAKGVPANG